ncbi:energy transducer TonB family protein [Noviherbaspirillum aerium]|uniref:energy transducer TonB family protein n=1 Tax=Noviherbaspirillum aerium TaxID=2588497 RepID=UPI001CEF873C
MHNTPLLVLVVCAIGACVSAIAQDASQKLPPRPIVAPINGCLAVTYPVLALVEEAEGSTHVVFTVLPAGGVTDVAISKASGPTPAHRALDKAAVKAISGCIFAEAPGFSSREVLQPIVWRLEDQ